MRARWLLLLGLVGCGGEASPEQPIPLVLVSPFDHVQWSRTIQYRTQVPTAVGGTQTFEVRHRGTEQSTAGRALELPFEVEVDDDSGISIEDRQEQRITIRGVKEGASTLRILYEDGAPMATLELSVLTMQKIVFQLPGGTLPTDVLRSEDRSFVWAPGDHFVGLELYGASLLEPVVDASLQIALAGAERIGFDTLSVPDAIAGTYPISVTAGGQPTTVDFVVVDQADSVSFVPGFEPAPTSLAPGRLERLCFEARSAGRYIVRASWTFTVVGEAELRQPSLEYNCIDVTPQQTSGEITVTATTLGQSGSLTLPVVAILP